MKNTKEMKYIFSMKLAGFLMMNGCSILRINHHLSRNGRNVYVFEKSDKLERIIGEYMNKKCER